MGREYKTGTRWCVWRTKDIGYIKRLHVIQTPFFSICVHWMRGPDLERDKHDHPVSFLSLCWSGWYIDEVKEMVVTDTDHGGAGDWLEYRHKHKRFHLRFIPASACWTHKIVEVGPDTMTICFMTGNKRVWGFDTEDGWVPWTSYEAKNQRPK